mmetsp:Transcript_8391/g.9219  ORF Transcript_8391/g.9219 Transcript_8391/m.9219 type:complete len:688 (+) Transcript_8391:103-2166(+)
MTKTTDNKDGGDPRSPSSSEEAPPATKQKEDNSMKSNDRARKEAIKNRLKSELKKEMKPLLLGSLAMICSAASNQAVPRLLGKVLDQNAKIPTSSNSCPINNDNNMNYLLLIVLGGGLSSFVRTTMLNRAQDGIASSLRSQLFKTLLVDRDVGWYHLDSNTANTTGNTTATMSSVDTIQSNDEKKKNSSTNKTSQSNLSHSPAAIQSILANDVDSLSSTLTTTLANTLRSTSSIIFATKNMVNINSNLLSISLSIVPIIGSAAVILNKFVKKIHNQYLMITTEAETFATERIEHISMVKISNRQEDEVMHYNGLQNKAKTLSNKSSWAKGLFMGFMFSSTSAALVLLFHLGGKSIAKGKMTHGELKTFATYTFMLGLGTSGVMKGLGQLVQGMVCAERIYNLIDGTDQLDDANNMKTNQEEKNVTTTCSNESINMVDLTNVNFAYASDPTQAILRNITMSIQRGEIVALAGANGAGKSTLASLLVALYKPQSGGIVVKSNDDEEGIDFNLLDRKTQSHLVQLVPQQPVMFEMSVKENVTYTNPNASDEEIQIVLNASNCNAFISQKDGGLDYNVGRNGCKLSGGQRQRLALARALLSDPALLILDEPNSHLDAEGDNAVADAVRTCRDGNISGKKRGLLLITHRVSTLELADRVIVLKNGEIVEEGKYVDLVESKESALCQLMPDLQ